MLFHWYADISPCFVATLRFSAYATPLLSATPSLMPSFYRLAHYRFHAWCRSMTLFTSLRDMLHDISSISQWLVMSLLHNFINIWIFSLGHLSISMLFNTLSLATLINNIVINLPLHCFHWHCDGIPISITWLIITQHWGHFISLACWCAVV